MMLSNFLGGSCGWRPLFLYYWFCGDFGEAGMAIADMPKDSYWNGLFLWLILLILEQCQKWTYICSMGIMPNEITAVRELALQLGNSSGLLFYVKEWKAMLARFFFFLSCIYHQELFYACSHPWGLSSPEHAHHQGVGRQWVVGCRGSSLYANTEESLLSSREMFNMFLSRNKVCVSQTPMPFHHKMEKKPQKWDSSHP